MKIRYLASLLVLAFILVSFSGVSTAYTTTEAFHASGCKWYQVSHTANHWSKVQADDGQCHICSFEYVGQDQAGLYTYELWIQIGLKSDQEYDDEMLYPDDLGFYLEMAILWWDDWHWVDGYADVAFRVTDPRYGMDNETYFYEEWTWVSSVDWYGIFDWDEEGDEADALYRVYNSTSGDYYYLMRTQLYGLCKTVVPIPYKNGHPSLRFEIDHLDGEVLCG